MNLFSIEQFMPTTPFHYFFLQWKVYTAYNTFDKKFPTDAIVVSAVFV